MSQYYRSILKGQHVHLEIRINIILLFYYIGIFKKLIIDLRIKINYDRNYLYISIFIKFIIYKEACGKNYNKKWIQKIFMVDTR
jgi:hypothetical protein